MRRLTSIFFVFIVLVSLSGCWYRQCPIKGCKVRYNHSHGGKILRGRGTLPNPFVFGMKRTKAEKREQSSHKRR